MLTVKDFFPHYKLCSPTLHRHSYKHLCETETRRHTNFVAKTPHTSAVFYSDVNTQPQYFSCVYIEWGSIKISNENLSTNKGPANTWNSSILPGEV